MDRCGWELLIAGCMAVIPGTFAFGGISWLSPSFDRRFLQLGNIVLDVCIEKPRLVVQDTVEASKRVHRRVECARYHSGFLCWPG